MSKRGENIFKRKDGRWEARYIHHYENGTAKYRYFYGKTYKEVKEKRISDQILQKSEPIIQPGVYIGFEELSQKWLNTVGLSVKESTYTRYVYTVNRYLMPCFSDRNLLKITPDEINELFCNMMRTGYKAALSPKTVSDIICVFKMIAKYGNTIGAINMNLTVIKHPQVSKKPVEILSESDLEKIEGILIKTQNGFNAGILFALFSGIRIGELCGIKWGDIDFDSATVTIRRTVERIKDLNSIDGRKTKLVVNTPKTESSYRIIPLQNFLLEYIKPFQMNEECYLLTGTTRHTEPHQYYVKYKKFLRDNQLGNYSFHALRHTFATRCAEAGFDTKTLSEILGHSSITTTLAVYIHPSMAQKKLLMERIIPLN